MGYVGRGLNQDGGQYRKLDDISSTFNGSNTSFSLAVSNVAVTPTAQNLLISINGVIQEPGSAFSMNGSTITFTEAPAGDSTFFGVLMGEASFIAHDTVGANEMGVTAGTVKASRGVVVDSSKNISGFNKIEIANSGSTDDALLITSTEDGSTASPVITLKRNSGSPADSDYIGQVKFKGENDNDQDIVYAKVTGKIQDASDGSEDGLIEFANKKAGSNVITARLRSDSFQLLNSTNFSVAGTSTMTGNVTLGGNISGSSSSTGSVGRLQTNQTNSSFGGNILTVEGTTNVNQDLTSDASPTFAGGTITGDFSVGGTLTAQEIHTEFESASILFTSGSTKFGDTSNDTHSMTGSLLVSGSITMADGDLSVTDDVVFGATAIVETGLNLESGTFTIKNATGDSNGLKISQGGSDASNILNHYNGTLNLGVANSVDMTLKSGRVGIGDTSPGSPLDVKSGEAANTANFNSTNGATNITFESNGSLIGQMEFSGPGPSAIVTRTSASLALGSNNVRTLYITDDDKVGIGTDSPSTATNVLLSVGNTSLGYAGMEFIAGTNAERWRLYTSYNGDSEAIWGLYSVTDGVYRFLVHEDGAMGIGTSSPNGNVEISGANGAQLDLSSQKTSIGGTDPLGDIRFRSHDSDNSGVLGQIQTIMARPNATHTTNITGEDGEHTEMIFRLGDDVGSGISANMKETLRLRGDAGNFAASIDAHGAYGLSIDTQGSTSSHDALNITNASDAAIHTMFGNGAYHNTGGIVFKGSQLTSGETGISSSGSGGSLRMFINGTQNYTLTGQIFTLDATSSGTPAQLQLKNTGSSGWTGAAVNLLYEGSSGNRGQGIYHHSTAGDREWYTGTIYGSDNDRWSICFESTAAFTVQTAEAPHEILYVAQSGGVYNDANTYGSTSDERLKHSITDTNSQWDDIKALKIKNYKHIKHGDNAQSLIGVIAQDLEGAGMSGLVDNQKVTESDIEMYENINEGDSIKTVKYSVLYMKAIKALQEAMTKIEVLETKVETLEGK
jgi:hypothetical protein